MKGTKVAFFISIMIHGLLLSRPGPPEESPRNIINEPKTISLHLTGKNSLQIPKKPQVQTTNPALPKKVKVPEKRISQIKEKVTSTPKVVKIPLSKPKPPSPNPVPLPIQEKETTQTLAPVPKIISPPVPSPIEKPMEIMETNAPEPPVEKIKVETQPNHPDKVVKQFEKPEEIRVSYRNLVGGYQVMPSYPISARREGREGTVLLKILVMEDGRIGKVIVTRSSDFFDLDQAAEEAVIQWSFEPALRNGIAVRQSALLPIRFALE